MSTFGEVDWSIDTSSSSKKFESAKDLFLKLDKGENEVRLVGKPYQYSVHTYKREGAPASDYGQKIKCTGDTKTCPLCLAGSKPKARWYMLAISRKSNKAKILDVGQALFSQIGNLARHARWGTPDKYDMNIQVNPKGGATGYYAAMPIEKSPLSAEDMKLIDDFDQDELSRRCTPLTADQVLKAIARIDGTAVAQPATTSAPVQSKPVVQAQSALEPADDDDEFPPAF